MKKKLFLGIILILFFTFSFASIKDLKLYYYLSKGNSAYKNKKYDKSFSDYLKAQGINPENPIVSYDIGNVLYKKGKFKKAMEVFEKILNSNKNLPLNFKNDIFYNLGNCYFRLKNYNKALNYYKKVLLNNPEDESARKNYELTLKKIKKNKNKNKNKNKENKKNNKKDKNKNKKENKKNKNRKEKKTPQKEKQKNKKNSKAEKKKEEKKEIKKMNEKVLQGLKEDEKKMLKKLLHERFKKIKKSGRDW